MSHEFIPAYDLESLNEEQRQDYIKAVCKHMGVPDNLNLVALTRMDDGEGPSRLVAYAKRGATENVRDNLGIDVVSLTSQLLVGSIVFTATGKNAKGRQEISTGAKYIEGLTGTRLDDAIMTAQTRATRRMTLQFVGAGVLDESEVHQGKTVTVQESTPGLALAAAQPTVQASSRPGKDITPASLQDLPLPELAEIANGAVQILSEVQETQEQFETRQAQLRTDAIAQLNAKSVKKTRKTRKPMVDLGPSEPVPTATAVATAPPTTIVESTTIDHVENTIAHEVKLPAKPRLTPEQVKPFRQRLFRVVNDYLEPNGFTPKEGMGNADKMKAFANIMFSDVQNLSELTVDQWEAFLSNLETRVKASPKDAVSYIEDAIGI
jgi:hypothetical protein